MDIFLKNYWSLYLEFLKEFEKLKYSGFSLPYLCHLPSFILNNDQILNELNDKQFALNLNNQVNDSKEFQAVFNSFIHSHEKKPLVKNKQGKVVIHVDKLLRFPTNSLTEFLDPSKTILLTKGGKKPSSSTKKKKTQKAAPTPSKKNNVQKSNQLNVSKRKLANRTSAPQKDEQSSPTVNKSTIKKVKVVSLTNTVNVQGKKRKKIQTVKKKNAENKNNVAKKIPYYQLFNYAIDTQKAVTKVQKQVRTMLENYKGHRFFKSKEFQTWFLNNIATVIYHIEMTKNFLNKVSTSCIVVSTTHSFRNRILALVAAEKGIPTICMQHGIISSELGYLPKVATIDAVYGNFEREWFNKMGAPDKSTEIIGHPRFDKVFTNPKISRKQFNKKLGLDSKRKTILIAVRGTKDIDKWRTLIQTITKKIPVNILIKNYPSTAPHALTKEFPFVYATQNYDIYDIFPYVDAVVTYSSTVGLEAMLAQKNVFILNENFAGYTGYYSRLGKLVQTDPKTLGDLIIDYFTNPQSVSYAKNKRIKFLANAYPDSKKSGWRLKNLINRLTT